MFTIYDSATEFKQWDLNQKVTEPSLVAGDKVVFQNSSAMTFPMKAYTHNGEVVVDVPNTLLREALPIVVYINNHCHETRTRINVVAQDKPEGYVFVDNDDWPSEGAEVDVNEVIDTLVANEQIGQENSKVYTYDGNMEGRLAIPFSSNMYCVKISDETPKISEFKRIIMSATSGIATIEPGMAQAEIVEGNAENNAIYGALGEILTWGGMPMVMSVYDLAESDVPATGLYVLHAKWSGDGDVYPTSVEIGEVHTMNPKYVFPHFDLAAMGLPAIPVDGTQVSWHGDTSAIEKAVQGGFIKITANVDAMGSELSVTSGIAFASVLGGNQGAVLMEFEDIPFYLTLMVHVGAIYATIKALATA